MSYLRKSCASGQCCLLRLLLLGAGRLVIVCHLWTLQNISNFLHRLTGEYCVYCWSGHFPFSPIFPLRMLLLVGGSQQHWSVGKEKSLMVLNCFSNCSLIPNSLQSLLLWHDKKYLGLMCLIKAERCITLICYGSIEKRHRTHREKSMVTRLERTKLERSGKGNVPRFLVGLGKVMRREGKTPQRQVIQKVSAAFWDRVGAESFLSSWTVA